MSKHMTIVILFMGTFTLSIVVGAMVLAWYGKAVPEPLYGIGGSSLGALAALLTGARSYTPMTRSTDKPEE